VSSRTEYARFWLAHRGKLLALIVCLAFMPLMEPPATAMGSRPRVAPAAQSQSPQTPEALLVQSLLDIQNNRLDSALAHIETVLSLRPNFRLAHLVKGDLLMARSRPISTLGDVADPRVQDFREEARVRLKRYLEPTPRDRLPGHILELAPSQDHALVVDVSRSRLFVYRNRNGEPELVADYYVTVGKQGADKYREGDQRTPLGVYFVVDELHRTKLTDFYGSGAFPINYPNEWDRRQGRTGSGIWLHGVPSDTYSRPPRASDGCVVLSNEDLDHLRQRLENVRATPVVITDGMIWLPPSSWRAQRAALAQEIERWRRDWESLDSERYLSHYSTAFHNGKQDFTAWAAQKRAVNAGKTHVHVAISELSMFRYPGRDDLVVVTFEQDYRSNNLDHVMRKRQYWQRENGRWKIVYEGAA
jgi:murein L,D-transpeptidase YafK